MPIDATHTWQGLYYKKGRFNKWFIWLDEWVLSDMDDLLVTLKEVNQI